ncbi:hypothetical protein PCG10_001347 [Penicillium crustosum]|uniref:Uncharacterized protein n=1 Tax=Penicillium crustosum TaxID=36656 RepID=A0A9P5GDC8_PENCR|nr:uncharacterized protein N7487_000989 [Penicillium crustosum]KAF7517246.1 hypothetical protein PCG10_001347 [Penicillium crustosum]KAJ5417439.1 hypothetical protein N7487_000989 [Penicillium crustosum]
MQLSILAIALSIGAVSAHNCQVGLRYCAYNLIGKGDYHSQVNDAMAKYYGTSSTNLKYQNPDYALYLCNGADDIKMVKDCNNYCSNGGDDKSDYCDN